MEHLLYSEFDPATSAAVEKLWVDARLDRWWKILHGELQQGDCFVVLGLEHILGPRGLLERLENAGYDVERVTANGVSNEDPKGR